jgi:hypothetical protein
VLRKKDDKWGFGLLGVAAVPKVRLGSEKRGQPQPGICRGIHKRMTAWTSIKTIKTIKTKDCF